MNQKEYVDWRKNRLKSFLDMTPGELLTTQDILEEELRVINILVEAHHKRVTARVELKAIYKENDWTWEEELLYGA